MPTPREHLAVAAAAGKVYAMGGRPGNVTTNEEYDPVSNSWSARAPMPTGRSGIQAAFLQGKLYVIGGEVGASTFSKNEAYNPASNSWESAASLLTSRHGLSVVALDGRIYAQAGGTEPGWSFSGINEVFVPPATPVPAVGQWGLAAGALVLAVLLLIAHLPRVMRDLRPEV